ncbi:hypothetical protein H7J87_20785 [Mycolicibacterium wolinskyi]|uniref:hypothetical protein n=1 Tax=Mycolicibacterium TaxID=1866885 RepID=UPI0013FDAF3F|nr:MULTISPECIES: hypothetical protein [Mycolicibacterium]MCV7287763.1 hypothetical protein [Mycolicibacterium wolinskyi]MCV7294661.1 hypothetical protein [Mycolicibacterium goodii]
MTTIGGGEAAAYSQAMLQIELSTGHFSCGDLRTAHGLGTAAFQRLSAIVDDHGS